MDLSHLFEPVPGKDWLVTALLFGGIVLVIGLSEVIRRTLSWPGEFTRKLVHILVGLLAFFLPILLSTSLPIVLLALFFSLSNLIAIRLDLLKGMHGARESYGTVYYPLALLILTLFAWPDHKLIIITAMLILGLGDAAAAMVGESLRKPRQYHLVGESKSIEGSATMFLVTVLVCVGVLSFYHTQLYNLPLLSTANLLWISVLTALYCTAAESLSYKGSDNLSVPLVAAVILYPMLHHGPVGRCQLTIGLVLSIFASIAFLKLRLLSNSGTVAVFLLATLIFGFGGWAWTIPILTFFLLSSLLSKVGKRRKAQFENVFEKGNQRDHGQVIANGGIAGLMMIGYMFLGTPMLYVMYLGSLAAATADTWATEIGTLARGKPRLITNLKPVAAGTSGAISLLGTVSGMIGAALIGLCGVFFPEISEANGAAPILLAAIIAGLVGNITDSFLGATLQASYKCSVCKEETERQFHCDTATSLKSGYRFVDNDAVNFLTTSVGAASAWLIYSYLENYPI